MSRLAGLRVVVTRAEHQAGELADRLSELGAEVIHLPTVEIVPPSDPSALKQAAAAYEDYDWIVFTSANAVRFFAAELPLPIRSRRTRVAAVGAATGREAEAVGFKVHMTPETYVAEALVESFAPYDLAGTRILIPSAAVARDVVPQALRGRGAQVDVVEAYRNVIPQEAYRIAAKTICDPFPHWITFASPSAVNNLIELIGAERLKHLKIATIGPVTTKAVERHGLRATAEARVASAAGLAEAIWVTEALGADSAETTM